MDRAASTDRRDGVTVGGRRAVHRLERHATTGRARRPQRVARNVASMLAVPSAFAVTRLTCVAGVAAVGNLDPGDLLARRGTRVVPTFGSSTHVAVDDESVLVRPGRELVEPRRAPAVLRRRPSSCPGCAQPSQLPTTSTADCGLGGWYQTVSEHDRCGHGRTPRSRRGTRRRARRRGARASERAHAAHAALM